MKYNKFAKSSININVHRNKLVFFDLLIHAFQEVFRRYLIYQPDHNHQTLTSSLRYLFSIYYYYFTEVLIK